MNARMELTDGVKRTENTKVCALSFFDYLTLG